MLNDLKIYHDSDLALNYGFQQADLDLLTNPQALEKIKRQFEKTSFKFNLYVFFDAAKVGKPKTRAWREARRRATQRHTDSITVGYANNLTHPDNYRPLTGWMLAHRMHHVMLARSQSHHVDMTFDVLTNKMLTHISQIMYPSKRHTFTLGVGNLLLTTRAARNKRLNNILDVAAEVLAQYIVTGRVKLNRLHEWDWDYHVRPDHVYDGYLPPTPVRDMVKQEHENQMNTIIDTTETDLNIACEQALNCLVGRTIIW
jgi:hypothetical protein